MTLKRLICAVLFVGFAVLLAHRGGAQDRLPILKTESAAYTNAEILNVTDSHVFIKNGDGVTAIKLVDLDEESRKQVSDVSAGKSAPASISDDTSAANFRIAASSRRSRNSDTPAALPPGRVLKHYPMGTAGMLDLAMPELWRATTEQAVAASTNAPTSLIIRFEHEFRDDFLLTVSAIPGDNKSLKGGTRAALESVGNHALRSAAETTLILSELTGDGVSGQYFTLTDKNLADATEFKPGTYKYQTQGLVTVEGITLSFAIFHNYTNTPDEKAALEMIRTARLEKPQPTVGDKGSN